MGNAQVKNIGQIQATEKPAKNKIGRADQQSLPRSQGSWSGIHAGQHVEQYDPIADDVVYFHGLPRERRFKQKSGIVSSNQLEKVLRGAVVLQDADLIS